MQRPTPDIQRPALDASRGPELLLLLCTSVVFISTTMGMLGPLLLQLSEEFGVSVAQAGLLATATALPWALAAPILGPLSDRFGRRQTLAVSLFGLGLLTSIGAAAPSFGVLGLIRVVSGVLASAGPTSLMAAVSDHFPPNKRASALGWVMSGFGISALVGVPAVGALAGALGWRAAFLLLGLSTMLLCAIVWRRLPGTPPRRASSTQPLGAYRAVLATRGVRPILVGNVLERCVFATFGLYLAPFLMQVYTVGLLEVAPLLALTAVGAILGNLLGGRLADRGSQPLIFAIGQLISAGFALALFTWSPGILGSVLLGLGFGLANAASRPAIVTMASGLSNEYRGTALGIFSFTNQAGWAAGPALSSLGFALAGYPLVGALCGLAAVGAALTMLALRPPTRPPPAAV